ncbi:hypothetical protein GK047_26135 [Paenibacillus sp. SYP-B3998]|uniref:Copper amine oxidase-like N-terminal domain-containing protein n=1 Tax=Paenibacillus sp. SYP-B3998 TaxID=2678564 RepID=A0A6G4A4I8_9BACL|nr:hypothetical protein [Paenibacillus sp. SYP-B3998]NEW09426.1 hypothetical protein [Paenibacillus sp. SYP-B3998]
MKKFVIGITSGVLLSFATGAFASSPTVQAILFPSTINVHKEGKTSSIGSNNTILNYNNSVYIPLRSFAENMGSIVKYIPPNSATDSSSQIDIYSAPEPWRLTAKAPGNLPTSPLSLKLNKIQTDTGPSSTSIGIYAELYNTSKEIINFTKTKLEIKIERVMEGQPHKLVWSGDISPPNVTPPGDLIPGSDVKVVWGIKSPILYWDKKDIDGNSVPPGQYQVSISQPITIEYNVGAFVSQERSESQTINPDLSNTIVLYVQ